MPKNLLHFKANRNATLNGQARERLLELMDRRMPVSQSPRRDRGVGLLKTWGRCGGRTAQANGKNFVKT